MFWRFGGVCFCLYQHFGLYEYFGIWIACSALFIYFFSYGGRLFFITGERRCLVYFILVFGDEKFVYIPLVTNV